MTLDELIEKLQKIRAEHGGDLPVLHHDDWEDFLVEKVKVLEKDERPDNKCPKRIVIEGDTKLIKYETGEIEDLEWK